MGKLHTKSGCLTCRSRRVKCDEARPRCGQCTTKSRSCQWEPSHTTFKGYQPRGSSSKAAVDGSGEGAMEKEEEEAPSFFNLSPERRNSTSRTAAFSSKPVSSHSVSALFYQPSTSSPSRFVASPAASSAGGISISGLLQSQHSESYSSDSHIIPLPTATPVSLTHDEALLVHHYAEHLGRWLDCTDASRQFTLRIPVLVKHCPILLCAVLSFAAKHRQDTKAADKAYEGCIALLIKRLNLKSAISDESLLCAIVILQFFKQLNVPLVTGSDHEQHLTGTSAILRASQEQTVDPSALTLRDAAFWVYVRQSLYSATVNQQPPNIDIALQLHPLPASIGDFQLLAEVNRETAWANAMTWLCASVVHFCFNKMYLQPASRMRQSLELWDAIEK